jgi:hypothetical protein
MEEPARSRSSCPRSISRFRGHLFRPYQPEPARSDDTPWIALGIGGGVLLIGGAIVLGVVLGQPQAPTPFDGSLGHVESRSMSRGAQITITALVLAWCGCAPAPLTQLVVDVDTDLRVPSDLTRIEISITEPDGASESRSAELASDTALPSPSGSSTAVAPSAR